MRDVWPDTDEGDEFIDLVYTGGDAPVLRYEYGENLLGSVLTSTTLISRLS